MHYPGYELPRNPIRRSSVAFIRYSSRVPKTTVFDPGCECTLGKAARATAHNDNQATSVAFPGIVRYNPINPIWRELVG
jgi:hypothetical protein